MVQGSSTRRLPIGAEVVDGGVHFRVWAPRRRRVDVVVDGRTSPLVGETGENATGYFSALLPGVRAGARYQFRLDGGDPRPDPGSRSQPDGPHGASCVVDPTAFRWTDAAWRGVALRGQVIYEMHVGTFTPEGSWKAAAAALDRLRGLCSVIEMMPVAEFPGDFGWGYDGVDFFAPTRAYGSPDDLRSFVDRAHALGLGVILDVVYNHVGPDGNYLAEYSDTYFSEKHKTEWGGALNYDGAGSQGVREFFVANAGYWIDEYHFDGLRLDATQAIFDDSKPHVLEEIGRRVRACARGRDTIVVVENESQDTTLIRSIERGGHGLDAAWNDDLHHSALVALTGQAEAYFSDHRGAPQEFVSAAKHGYLFQGQRYSWQKAHRGWSTRRLAPEQFVTFLENHDQVANTSGGRRLTDRAQPARLRALTAFVLLGPGTPMLFQGQEFASSAPFVYFAHHRGELAEAVRNGRAEFLRQFPSAEASGRGDDPSDPSRFAACKLIFADDGRHGEALALHRDLFALRRSDPTLRAQGAHGFDGAVIAPNAFVLRLYGERDDDRLLLVNLGPDFTVPSMAEPLVAAPHRGCWHVIWSSEELRYGGDGVVPPVSGEGWRVRGESATVLAPQAHEAHKAHERNVDG